MRARGVALGLVAVLAFYLVTVGWRGVLLVADGRPASVLLGLGVIALPLVAVWVVWKEVRFGMATQRLAGLLEQEGRLPVDDLPRRPSGRVDRAAADAAFQRYQEEVQQAPGEWQRWFRLATAYDAAGDRRRAREAMRRAIALEQEHVTR